MAISACENDDSDLSPETTPLLCYSWNIDKIEVYVNDSLAHQDDMSGTESYIKFNGDGCFQSNMMNEDKSLTQGTYTYKTEILTLDYLKLDGEWEKDTAKVILLNETNIQIKAPKYYFEDPYGIDRVGEMILYAYH